jgi:hypothetical protein
MLPNTGAHAGGHRASPARVKRGLRVRTAVTFAQTPARPPLPDESNVIANPALPALARAQRTRPHAPTTIKETRP